MLFVFLGHVGGEESYRCCAQSKARAPIQFGGPRQASGGISHSHAANSDANSWPQDYSAPSIKKYHGHDATALAKLRLLPVSVKAVLVVGTEIKLSLTKYFHSLLWLAGRTRDQPARLAGTGNCR